MPLGSQVFQLERTFFQSWGRQIGSSYTLSNFSFCISVNGLLLHNCVSDTAGGFILCSPYWAESHYWILHFHMTKMLGCGFLVFVCLFLLLLVDLRQHLWFRGIRDGEWWSCQSPCQGKVTAPHLDVPSRWNTTSHGVVLDTQRCISTPGTKLWPHKPGYSGGWKFVPEAPSLSQVLW